MSGESAAQRPEDQALADRRTLAALAAGDPAALDRLYHQYAALVMTVTQRMVRDRRLAEELLQDVFLRIWQRAETYEPERGHVRNWILGIAHNLALNELRRQRRRPAIADVGPEPGHDGAPDDPIARMTDPGPLPEEFAWLRERQAMIAGALASLPVAQRDVIRLYATGYSQSEIADRLEEPLGTIKSRMRRGLLQLRDLVPDLGPERH